MSEQADVARLKIVIHGAVQGVGFRPFVYRLATELHLKGWVLNSAQGVFIEVEGTKEELEEFLRRLPRERPPTRIHPKLRTFMARPRRLQSL
jgi:hydrogenase maturation protein HypF